MRKFTIAVLSAILVVALAAIAYAQYAQPTHSMTAKVTPTKAGTKKKPAAATATLSLTTGANDQSTVSNFTFQFPKELKVSTKGFKYCAASKIVAAGDDSVCPAKSKVGNGTALAAVGKRSGTQINFKTTVYAGSNSSLVIWLVGQGNFSTIKRALVGPIQGGTNGFKQNLSVDIPKDVQFVGGSVPVVLENVLIKLGATVKVGTGSKQKKYSILSASGCPANKTHQLGTVLTYSVPAGATSNAKATTACKK